MNKSEYCRRHVWAQSNHTQSIPLCYGEFAVEGERTQHNDINLNLLKIIYVPSHFDWIMWLSTCVDDAVGIILRLFSFISLSYLSKWNGHNKSSLNSYVKCKQRKGTGMNKFISWVVDSEKNRGIWKKCQWEGQTSPYSLKTESVELFAFQNP